VRLSDGVLKGNKYHRELYTKFIKIHRGMSARLKNRSSLGDLLVSRHRERAEMFQELVGGPEKAQELYKKLTPTLSYVISMTPTQSPVSIIEDRHVNWRLVDMALAWGTFFSTPSSSAARDPVEGENFEYQTVNVRDVIALFESRRTFHRG
jgi:hypothetical protein